MSDVSPALNTPPAPGARPRVGPSRALLILAAAGLVLVALAVLAGAQGPRTAETPTATVAPPTAFAAGPAATDTTHPAPATATGTAPAPAPPAGGTLLPVGAGGATGTRCWAAVAPPAGPPLLFGAQLVSGGGALWLFGASIAGDQAVPQLARWDGTRWVAAPAPPPGPNQNLTALLALAPDDLWAAGMAQVLTGTTSVLEHWDGRQWSASPMPGGAAFASASVALSASGPDDLWAGGAGAGLTSDPLLLHWDGHAWQATPAPATRPGTTIVTLAALGPADAWAAGAADEDLASTWHWDGRAWQPVPLPPGMGRPAALAAPAADHVWLAGRTADHQPVLLRWTGQTWQQLPRPLGGSSSLVALAAAGPEDLWTLADTEGQDVPTQVLHWTAAGWTDAPQPALPAHSHLTSLVLGPDGALWAAGAYTEDISGVQRTLVLRYGAGPCAAVTPTPAVAAAPTRTFALPGPLPTAVAGGVVVPGGDHYIFAFRATSPNNSLVAYDYERQTEIPIRQFAGTGYEVSHLASDGQVVVWVQNHPPDRLAVEGYDLRTQTAFQVAQAPDTPTRFGGLAVAGGAVYYTVVSPIGASARPGIYAHRLGGGADTLISAAGQDPVAGDGVLLWQEAAPQPSPTPLPSVAPPPTEDPDTQGAPMVLPGSEDCTLHLRTLDGSAPDQVIARFSRLAEGGACFAGYAVSGDHVVWTDTNAGASQVVLYTRSTATTQPLAAVEFTTSAPLIAGPLVVWSGPAAANPGQSALLGYRIDTGSYLRLLPQADAPIQPQFILNGRTVVYTLSPGPGAAPFALYAVDVPGP